MFSTLLESLFFNVLSVLSQCNAWLKLVHLFYVIQVIMMKINKPRFFSHLCCDKPWVFDQSECAPGPIYIIVIFICINLAAACLGYEIHDANICLNVTKCFFSYVIYILKTHDRVFSSHQNTRGGYGSS